MYAYKSSIKILKIRRLLQVHCTTHVSNVEMHGWVAEHIGKCGERLEIIKKRKVWWFGHVVRAKGTRRNTILLQGKVEWTRGRPARQWMDNIKEWIGPSSNEMWREPDNCVAWWKRVNPCCAQRTEQTVTFKIKVLFKALMHCTTNQCARHELTYAISWFI